MFDPRWPLARVGANCLENSAAASNGKYIRSDAIATYLRDKSVALAHTMKDLCDDSGLNWRQWPTARLIEHIVSNHHEYLREILPSLHALTTRVVRLHGRRHPQLEDLIPTVRELTVILLPHLEYEEQKLFPSLVDDSTKQTVADEFRAMHDEHREVTRLFERFHSITNDFQVPDWACNSYWALIADLEHLERNLARHTHLETHGLYLRFAIE